MPLNSDNCDNVYIYESSKAFSKGCQLLQKIVVVDFSIPQIVYMIIYLTLVYITQKLNLYCLNKILIIWHSKSYKGDWKLILNHNIDHPISHRPTTRTYKVIPNYLWCVCVCESVHIYPPVSQKENDSALWTSSANYW